MDEKRSAEDERPSPAQKRKGAVFVERSTEQWVVQDPDGNFWVLPAVDEPWLNRKPFQPTEETGLDPVPGHYKHILNLPF